MTPRNAILFFIIFAVVVGGGVLFFVIGKNKPKQNLAEELPPPTTSTPPTNNTTDQNQTPQKPKESWFSKLFSMPSFENLAPNFLPSLPTAPESVPTDTNPTNPTSENSPEINSNFSPLKNKVELGSNRSTYYGSGDKDAVNQEYLSIQTKQNITEKIHLTGLVIKSAATGVKVVIGQGVYLYFSGMVNPPQDIFLGPNETAYIITGRSPLGVSFKVNKCLGYLSKNQDFNPYLRSNCPAVKDEPMPKAPNQLNDKCLDYIERFPSCTAFTTGELELSPECNNFLIEKTNYGYCVQTHKNDKDFYDDDWRIYLSRDETLWKSKRETIELLDQNGKLIDSVSY